MPELQPERGASLQRRHGLMFRVPIKIWRFEHAPIELERLSTHGGNGDWLLLFPRVENRARLLLEVTQAVLSVKQLREMKMLPAGMRNP